MHITLFMTMSLNGMTSRPDYREDFLSAVNWFSFLDCARETGALIWGRKTHEKVLTWNRKYLEEIRDLTKVVVSTRRDVSADLGFELASSPAEAVRLVESKGISRATLAGGSILNSSFARQHLIDEVIVNVEGVVIGKGIPLFEPDDFDLRLDLLHVLHVDPNIVQLKYVVRR